MSFNSLIRIINSTKLNPSSVKNTASKHKSPNSVSKAFENLNNMGSVKGFKAIKSKEAPISSALQAVGF